MRIKKQIVILGAGSAGLALALKLLRRSDIDAEIAVMEEKPYVGGIAASFKYNDLYFDYGSHRLHPSIDPEILQDIRNLLGAELVDRPRNGRIHLSGRFVEFPLKPHNLIRHLPLSFFLGLAYDTAKKLFRNSNNLQQSYADVLLNSLGNTMCNTFYFPYARKLWGLNPEEISAVQAQRRISEKNICKIIYKTLAFLPDIRSKRRGRYFYPQRGFGQICQSIAQEVERLGGKILLSTSIHELRLQNKSATKIVYSSIANQQNNKKTLEQKEITADFLFSTIPFSKLIAMLSPEPPRIVKDASRRLKSRCMILHYMILPMNQFTTYGAHYFPEENVIFSRVSEPKNYSNRQDPKGITGLCSEIPCNTGDDIWNAAVDDITNNVLEDLKRVGLPVQSSIKDAFVRRLPEAYPIYDLDFESNFNIVDEYINKIPCLVSLGRQGLFSHDNTHHAMEMAYRASECLQYGLAWNLDLWSCYRKRFSEHVVED